MRCTFTEDLRNFWLSYRQWSRCHITLGQVNTTTHAVHWLTQILLFRNFPNSDVTQKVNHSEFHCGIVWLQLLLRHYNCLPDTSNLSQATQRTVIRRAQCA